MKKVLLFLLVVFTSFSCYAQEKEFKEAMKEGRKAGQFYHWQNNKNKMLKEEKMKQYARDNHIIIKNYKTKEISRFGDVAISVGSMDFIPESEIGDYIIESITGQTPISSFQQKGTVFFFDGQSAGYQNYQDRELSFKRYDNALWTGEIRNGRVHGTGKGVKRLDATNYIAFEGTFYEGIPQGKGIFRKYKASSQSALNEGNLSENKSTTGQTVEGMTQIYWVSGVGFLNSEGVVVITPQYKKVSDFHDGIARVEDNSLSNFPFYIDKQGVIVAASDGKRTTPASKIPANTNRGQKDFLTNLKEGIDNGEYASAAVLDEYLKTRRCSDQEYLRSKIRTERLKPAGTSWVNKKIRERRSEDKELVLLLLKTSSKTGYDKYQADVTCLQDLYKKAMSHASAGKREWFNDDGFCEGFIDFYSDYPQYDKQQKIATAQLIDDFSKVTKALSTTFYTYWYWGKEESFAGIVSLSDFSMDYERIYEDRDLLKTAIATCSAPESPFANYYNSVLPALNARQQELEAKIENDRRTYEKYWAEKDKDRARRQAWRNEMCDNCKIDGNKTTFPKGYVEAYSGLFTSYPAQSEESGKIVLKNGNTTTWKYIYDNPVYIEAKGGVLPGYSEKYNSVEELVETIIRICKQTYCQ